MSRKRLEPHLQSILESTRGIAFLGTPHHGVDLAKWAELLCRFVGLIKATNPALVKVLRAESEVLARIKLSFDLVTRSRAAMGQPIEITSFYETLPIRGIGQVVAKHSAILLGYNPPIGIRANHMDMTRFSSTEDPGFVAVCRELGRWVKGIARPEATQQKQGWVSIRVNPVPVDRMLEDVQTSPCKYSMLGVRGRDRRLIEKQSFCHTLAIPTSSGVPEFSKSQGANLAIHNP
jgi:hypothetical protein